MEFREPLALLLLALLPVGVWAWRRRRRAVVILPSTAGLAAVRPTLRLRAARALPVALLLAAGIGIVALAGPRRGEAAARVPAEGIDIVLALDISSSMTAPLGDGRTRIEATKEVVREFIRSRENDRVGLVVFQRDALPIAPPTLDHRALEQLVEELSPGLLPDGTGIGVGIGAALTMLRSSDAASRIVILLTDGRHNAWESIAPEEAAELAALSGVPVYTIAVIGSSPGTRLDIDEAQLRAIAERTGGRFFLARSTEELREVYEEIARLETSAVERDRFLRYSEFGPPLAGVAGAAAVVYLLGAGAGLWRRP